MLEYLRTEQDPRRDEEILEQLESVESLSVPRLAEMASRLPMPHDPAGNSDGGNPHGVRPRPT